MTNCTGTPTDQYLERYIQGILPELEAQEFEEHYFECPVCLAQVEALQAIARQLANEPRMAPKAPLPWPIRAGALMAIAAALLIGFLNLHGLRQATQPAVASGPAAPGPAHPSQAPTPPSLSASPVSRLADLTLPAFQSPNLRGQSGDPRFDAGMKAYTRQDCSSTVKALSLIPAHDEDSLAAEFYAGVCQMHEGDLNAASKSLKSVAGAGDSPQQEAALYFLAQIALKRNDATEARHYLTRTVSLRGDFEQRARSELIQVR